MNFTLLIFVLIAWFILRKHLSAPIATAMSALTRGLNAVDNSAAVAEKKTEAWKELAEKELEITKREKLEELQAKAKAKGLEL